MRNRLNLDFTLQSQEERVNFTNTYLASVDFQLTEAELDTIAKYILWGKDAKGQNAKQSDAIELETAHHTWDPKDLESLDGLQESPTFQEASLRPLNEVRLLIRKKAFDRAEAIANAPEHLLPTFNQLWAQIDETEYLIQSYELAHNKRTKPIRQELINSLTDSQRSDLDNRACKLSQASYLKLRHFLVELRNQQFTLRDSYHILYQTHTIQPYSEPQTAFFGPDIPVFPLGLRHGRHESIFSLSLSPSNFSESELTQISDLIWSNARLREHLSPAQLYFDFTDLEHLYRLILTWRELDSPLNDTLESTFDQFIDTFNFYRELAELTPIQSEVIDYKIKQTPNLEIAQKINQKYGTTYNANYISTIFRQKALKKIAEAAQLHYEIVSNLFFPENFKVCKECGRTLLLNEEYFVHKAKSKDGFSNRCKKCDKEIRDRKKT